MINLKVDWKQFFMRNGDLEGVTSHVSVRAAAWQLENHYCGLSFFSLEKKIWSFALDIATKNIGLACMIEVDSFDS